MNDRYVWNGQPVSELSGEKLREWLSTRPPLFTHSIEVDGMSLSLANPPAEADDPSGPWTDHPDRDSILEAHTKIVWSILESLRAELETDRLLRREVQRVLTEPCWAATECVRSRKLRLRYISEGVFELCKQHGPLDQWAKEGKKRRNGKPPVCHEHVTTKKRAIEDLLAARSPTTVRRVLASCVACVVTPEEHRLLDRVKGDGWERYQRAAVGVWDRADQKWKVPPDDATSKERR